jgi:hypothetical protein
MTLDLIQGNLLADVHTCAVFHAVNAELGGGLIITAPDGADRSDARQRVLIALHKLNPKKYAYAAPVGKSNHKGGRALDIQNWAQYPELRAVMLRHGLVRDPVERWHYNDTGTWIIPAAVHTTPLEAEEEDEMDKVELIFDGKAWYATRVGAPRALHLSPPQLQHYREYQGGKREGDINFVQSIEAVHAAMAPGK